MKRKSLNKATSSLLAHNFISKLILSFVAAQLLVVKAENVSYTIILSTPYFLKLLLINWLMAYLLIATALKLTQKLDHHHPWHCNYKFRIAQQVFWGILLPISPVVLIAALYFLCFEISISKVQHFERYLLEVFFYLLSLNLYLLHRYKNRNQETSIKDIQNHDLQ